MKKRIIGSKIAIHVNIMAIFLNTNKLLNQTHINWTLYVRDDGSTDNTLNILKKYKKHPFKINIIKDDLELDKCISYALAVIVNADYHARSRRRMVTLLEKHITK